jgi:hypothetical protein
VKSTTGDSVALTMDLYAVVIESKDEQPRRDWEQLLLAIAALGNRVSVRDEQVLELP